MGIMARMTVRIAVGHFPIFVHIPKKRTILPRASSDRAAKCLGLNASAEVPV